MANKLVPAELLPNPTLAIDPSDIATVNTFYFFEKLGLSSILKFWLRSLFSRRLIHIHYIDITQSARRAIRMAGSRRLLFKCFEFRLADVKDAEGDLENLNAVYTDGLAFKKVVMAEMKSSMDLASSLSKPLQLYASKSALYENQLMLDSFHRAMFILRLVSWYSRREKLPDDRIILNLNYRGWQPFFKKAFAHIPFAIQFYRTPFVNRDFIRKLVIGSLGDGIFALLKIKAILKKQSQSAFKTTDTDKIFVKTFGSANFTDPSCNSDVFFCFDTDIRPDEVVVAVDSHFQDLDQVIEETVEAGACPLITAPAFAGRHGQYIAHYKPRTKLPFSQGQQKELQAQPWLNRRAKQYALVYDRWYQFFKQSHSKIFFEWYKYDNAHIPISEAIRDLGGHSVIYQRAYEEFPCNEFTLSCDLGLFWNETALQAALNSGSSIRHAIVIGYLKDYCFAPIQKNAGALKKKLRDKGATTILSYYDEGSAPDHRWHTGHSFMRENYQYIFEKVLEHDWLGLVIKPKVPSTLPQRLGHVAPLMEAAIATGRCHFYEDQHGHGSSFPVAYAAYESDIAIHGHLCAGSAGIEAALSGIPTLLVDREGWQRSQMQELGPLVAFKTWDDLWDAVKDHHKKANPNLGIWHQDALRQYDPYLDGKTNQRLGLLLRSLLEGHQKKGLSQQQILDDTMAAYKDKWGSQGIISQ